MRAEDLTGEAYHHTVEDVNTLKELARLLPENPVIVNIGACFGTSVIAMLEERPDAVIFSVDVHQCLDERANAERCGVDPARIIRVLGRSQEVGAYWPIPTDLVFVDGAHGYQDVVEDIINWSDTLRSEGIIAFDDYGKDICPDVKPAVDSLLWGQVERVLHVGDIIAFKHPPFVVEKKEFERQETGFTSLNLAGPDPNPMTEIEVHALKTLAWELQIDPIVVNIGAERGTSTLAILEEIQGGAIFSIDVNPCPQEMENVRRAGLDARRVIRLLGRSQEIGRHWPVSVDLVWVDGDHSYEAVAEDIETWGPRVKRWGYLAFHDYFEGDPPPHNPSGAGVAVREKIIGNPQYELLEALAVERLRAFRKVV